MKDPVEVTPGVKVDKRKQNRAAALVSAIENIKAVSCGVIKDLKEKFYSESESKSEFNYKNRFLSESEIEFYTTCQDFKGIIERNRQQIEIEYGEKYNLFPLEDFNEEQLQGKLIFIIYLN